MGFEFSRRQWLTIVVISVADFCNAICVSLQAPFYPKEAEKKDCTATEYGLVFGVFELVVFLVSPVYGAHLNRIGPKFLFNIGILTTGTCAILFGLLDKLEGHLPFITLSFLIRIVEAMGNAAFLIASFAIIAKEFPNNVATMFASLETFFGLGLIVGPTLGGALYDIGGYSLPFAVLGSALFLAALMSCFALPLHNDDEDVRSTGPTMLTLLRIPGVLLAAISIISTSMSIGFLQVTLEPHLRQFSFSPVVLGLMFVINGGVYALSAPAWGWLCDRPSIKPKYITVIGCLFIAAGFLLIGPAPFFDTPTSSSCGATTYFLSFHLKFHSQKGYECANSARCSIDTLDISLKDLLLKSVTIVGLVLHGLGIGCQLVASFSDALSTSIARGLPNSIETYGLVSGMWTSTFALGAFIGPTVSGVLFDKIGFRSSTLFIFILHVCVMIIVLLYLWTYDCKSKLNVSVSAGDLLQVDGTLDGSVLIGDDEYTPLAPKIKRWVLCDAIEYRKHAALQRLINNSRCRGISVEQSRPPAMNSLIACSSYKNRRSPWSQRNNPRHRPSYGSLDSRFRGHILNT